MRIATRTIVLFMAAACLNLAALESQATAQEPTWYPSVIVRGSQRAIIQQTPIQMRPYRPLHFYGNTQRRVYYRGNPMPQFRDFQMTGRQLITRAGPGPSYGQAYGPTYGQAFGPSTGQAYGPAYGPGNYRVWR